MSKVSVLPFPIAPKIGASPFTQILKRLRHDHINSFYCGEGQELLQKIADLNRAQGVSWQHCLQAARGREEKQPIWVCSCHISEQHSNLVNILLLDTKPHRSEAIFTVCLADLCIMFPSSTFTAQSRGLLYRKAFKTSGYPGNWGEGGKEKKERKGILMYKKQT